MVAQPIDGGVILVHTRRGDVMERLYLLNDVGAFVWDRIDGERTVAELANDICGSFAVDLPQAEVDLLAFLQQLKKIGAIKLSVRKHSLESS